MQANLIEPGHSIFEKLVNGVAANYAPSCTAAWSFKLSFAKKERPSRKVSTRLSAKRSTALNSSMPETGSTFHAKESSPS